MNLAAAAKGHAKEANGMIKGKDGRMKFVGRRVSQDGVGKTRS